MKQRSLYRVGSNQYKLLPQKSRTIRQPITKKSYRVPTFILALTITLVGATNIPSYQPTILSPYVGPSKTAQIVNVAEASEPKFKDMRANKLYEFLVEKDSPLADHADYIVEQADLYDISWTLVAAISGKESSFGKAIKPGSHNAWGIMAWDKEGVRHIRSFKDWKEGIAFTTKLLSENYRENMNRGIQVKYCPSFECSDTWVDHVTTFQEEINE